MTQDLDERNSRIPTAQGICSPSRPSPLEACTTALFSEFPVPLLVVNPWDGSVIDANRTASLLLGYKREQFSQKTFMQLVLRNPEETLRILRGVGPGCSTTLGCLFRALDGKPVEVEASLRRAEVEGRAFLCCALHDVSLRSRQEQERIQAERLRAVETLATAIAHDFNNILSGILGFAEMTLDESGPLPSAVLRNQERIIGAVGRAKALVAQIQTFGIPGTSSPEAAFSGSQASVGSQTKSASVPPRSGGRILFVDDEEILVALGKGVLEHLGYEVVAVQSSREALDLFRATPDRFDLLITDHIMPKMTGAELAREVSSIRANFPAIVCSGTLPMAVSEGAGIPAIRRFVSKPFSIAELSRAITETLGTTATMENEGFPSLGLR